MRRGRLLWLNAAWDSRWDRQESRCGAGRARSSRVTGCRAAAALGEARKRRAAGRTNGETNSLA